MSKQLSFDFPLPEGMRVIFRPYRTLVIPPQNQRSEK